MQGSLTADGAVASIDGCTCHQEWLIGPEHPLLTECAAHLTISGQCHPETSKHALLLYCGEGTPNEIALNCRQIVRICDVFLVLIFAQHVALALASTPR